MCTGLKLLVPPYRTEGKTNHLGSSLNLKPKFRHQRLPEWDGHGYNPPNISTGGCSSLGVDVDGRFGLVYKAIKNTGGIYRVNPRSPQIHQYVQPIPTRNIPNLRKF